MKTTLSLVSLLLVIPFGSPLTAQSLEFKFEDVDRFRDFSLQGMQPKRTQPVFEKEVIRALEPAVKKSLAEGQVLEITFTDIDMAGEIQPWRNRNNADIRYVESIYPPRLSFNYALRDAEGTLIDEGSAKVTDLAYTMDASFVRSNESFAYETRLLERWIRRNFGN